MLVLVVDEASRLHFVTREAESLLINWTNTSSFVRNKTDLGEKPRMRYLVAPETHCSYDRHFSEMNMKTGREKTVPIIDKKWMLFKVLESEPFQRTNRQKLDSIMRC